MTSFGLSGCSPRLFPSRPYYTRSQICSRIDETLLPADSPYAHGIERCFSSNNHLPFGGNQYRHLDLKYSVLLKFLPELHKAFCQSPFVSWFPLNKCWFLPPIDKLPAFQKAPYTHSPGFPHLFLPLHRDTSLTSP